MAGRSTKDTLPPEPALLKVYAGLTSGLAPVCHLIKPFLRSYGGFKDTVPERLGRFSPALDEIQHNRGDRKLVWIHAVSVGEAAVAGALLGPIKSRVPDALIAISTVTLTGRDFVTRNMKPDALFFLPFDLPGVVTRLVGKMRPDCYIDIEVELWPNLLRKLSRDGVPMALANGRMSDRAANPPAIWRPILMWALSSFDALFMRSREDVERAVALGAPRERTHLAGNLKFAAAGKPPDPAVRARLRELLNVGERGKLFVAGSTHPGEDEQVIAAWVALNNGLLPENTGPLTLIIAPRHLEQVQNVSNLVRRSGNGVALWTDVSKSGGVPSGIRAVVVDTIGELMKLYGAADVAFVGGSLVPRGGHNVLEPVAAGVPTLHGPSMSNFHDLVRVLGDEGLLREVADSKGLADGVLECVTRVDIDDYRRRAAELIGKQLRAADMIADWVAACISAGR
jgi:3-deoxy-D-manno-octulosonic-acid transferase